MRARVLDHRPRTTFHTASEGKFSEVPRSTRTAQATLKIPLGAIRFWGRPALGHYLRVPPSNVVGARGSSMRIPTWLLVLLVGAGILLLVVVSVRLIL
jgi:hypothetical protein